MSWTCPDCGRTFRRNRQSHECAPALSLEQYFATGPEWERPIFEAVRAHLESLGPMVIEPVSVGIFFKSNGTLVQLRPKTKWVAMSFPLSRRLSIHVSLASQLATNGRSITSSTSRRPPTSTMSYGAGLPSPSTNSAD